MRFDVKSTLLVFACLHVTASDPTGILSLFKLFGATTQLVRTGWDIAEELSDIPLPVSLHRRENMILSKLTELGRSMETLSEHMQEASVTAVSQIVDALSKVIKVELGINDLNQYAATIGSAYRDFIEYANQRDEIAQTTLENFAWAVISHDAHSVRSTMDRIHAFIVPSGALIAQSGLPRLLLLGTEAMDGVSICNSQQSPQQMLYNFYNNLAIVEIKGYAMVQFSYMLLKLYGKENYTKEAEIYKQRFVERSSRTLAVMKPEIEMASRELRRCDPKRHVEGQTYIQITQLLQGYIQNEVDLNSDGTCKENCAAYTYTKSHSCYQNLYCREQPRCKGTIYNCQFVTSHMSVCPSRIRDHRRYEYVSFDDGPVYGRKGRCPNNQIRVESWWRWVFWHCSYCMCLCDEEGPNSDRYISLREVTSDVESNKVITGLRFVKNDRIFHLQIQEGVLNVDGVIGNDTVRWVPVQTMNIYDMGVYNGRDYFTLTWKDRAMNLDDIVADTGNVLTGVKFSKVRSHIYLEVRITPFDFATGKLLDPLNRSIWKHNLDTNEDRTEIHLEHPDVPTRTMSPAPVLSTTNQHIRFTHTGFNEDVAQTTVPFFDAQPVVSKLPVPLAGAGVYYKGQKNYGGFIAPKLVTYDYSAHLKEILDNIDVEEKTTVRDNIIDDIEAN